MTSEDRVPGSAFADSGDAPAPNEARGDADCELLDVPNADVEDLTVEVGATTPLEVALTERDEYLEALRRLQAEFDNYRKRVIRQQTEHLTHATEALLERLLPVLDAFDLALAHASAPAAEDPSDLTAAFTRIDSLLRDILAKEGLERIDTTGVAFDPTVHDAVAHVTREEAEMDLEPGAGAVASGHPVVDDVMRAGYQLKGRVLRTTMVRVRG